MRTTNYPNHPLFRITPLLNDGQNTVRHDEYTSSLIGRIRAGRYMTELWDCNSLILGYSERVGSPAYQQVAAVQSRYKMTPEELEAYRNSPEVKAERARQLADQQARRAEKKAQHEAEETALAARRRAMAEERERFEREYAEAKARRQADQEQRDREWAERAEALAREAAERRERARAQVAAELARRNAEYAEASVRMEQRAGERALRRIAEERAKPEPNAQLLAIFSRWLEPETTDQNP
jgi:hypothetical protein